MTNKNENFTTTIRVNQTPHAVFEAITNVKGWWSENIIGNTQIQGDEFEFEVKGVHYSKQKLVEVIPDQRIVWLVTESNMTFIPDHDEWTDTKVIFDITQIGQNTVLTFTHEGLVPSIACYGSCMPAWTQYIEHSLKQLIQTGIGDPNLEGRTIDQPISSNQ